MLEKAIQIAVSAHKEQVDKSEQPYILHLIRVMDAGETEQEKICGILHDLVEDTDWTFEKLENEGFSEEIISALKCVTKQENEDYAAFIGRVKTNPLAIKVKLNDLRDNMDITRLFYITEKDRERLNKYLKAYQELKCIS
jgi:hypothetical protein